jgi:hypothetical protein
MQRRAPGHIQGRRVRKEVIVLEEDTPVCMQGQGCVESCPAPAAGFLLL